MRRPALAVALVLVVLVVPGTAAAETYCVENQPCEDAGGAERLDFQSALNSAASNPGRDRVELGPVSFVGSSGVNGFAYGGPDPVDIVGSSGEGGAHTVLSRPPITTDSAFGFVLSIAAAGSKVQNLAIRLPSESGTPANTTGVGLEGDLDVSGISVQRSSNPTDTSKGGQLSGTVRDSLFDAGEQVGGIALGTSALGTSLTVEGVSLFGNVGLNVANNSTVGRRLFIATGDNSAGVVATAGLTLDSSVIHTRAGGVGVDAQGGSTVDVRNATLLGNGSSSTGGRATTDTNASADLTVDSTIIDGFTNSFSRNDLGTGQANVTVRYSNFTAPNLPGSGAGTYTPGTGNTSHANPRFASATGQLAADSPLVDAGNPSAIPGESTLDLIRAPRILDGNGDGTARRDMGAFEFVRDGDGDGVPDHSDTCPAAAGSTANGCPPATTPTDPSPGPSAPSDRDGDGVPDASDACPDQSGPVAGCPATIPGPTNGDDVLKGTPAGETICGLLGDDTIDGVQGNDTLFGDACNDTQRLFVGAAQAADGNDRLSGSEGNDTLYGAGGRDKLDGGAGNDKLFGGGGNDSLTGAAGNDSLRGDAGNDTLGGGAGRDKLDGGAGNDKLNGGEARNSYKGGAGDDTINAANGQRETVDCGAGRKDSARVDRTDTVKGCEKVKRAR